MSPGLPQAASASIRGRLPAAWAAALVLAAAGIALYYLPDLGPVGRTAVYLAVEAAAVLAVAAACLLRRPASVLGWAIIGAGMACVLAGDAVWFWQVNVAQAAPSPSLADAFYLAEYPFLVAGAMRLVRGKPRAGLLIDVVIACLGLALVVWEFVIRPTLDASGPTDAILVAAAYPIADIALLAAAVGLLLGTGLPSASLRLLAGGFAVTFVADVLNLRLTLVGEVPDPSWLDAAWLGSMALWAAAALHPSASRETWVAGPDWHRPRLSHLALLSGSALLVPATLIGLSLVGEPADVPVLATVWIALVLITANRVLSVTAQVRRSEDRFRAIFEGSPLAMAVVRGHRVLMANDAARRMFGGKADADLSPRRAEDVLEPSLRDEVLERVLGGEQAPLETVGVRLDGGGAFPMVVHARPIGLSDGAATALFLEDVSAARASEASLLASERRYRDLFEGNPQPMWVYDRESLAFLAVNDVAVARYGWSREEFATMTIADIRPPGEVPAVYANLARVDEAIEESGPWLHRRKDGSTLEVEITSHAMTWDGHPARLVLAADVTRRRALEDQLRQAQKMEAVGRLAGGVAHDFNNLLTAILGYGEMLRDATGPADARRGDVEQILRAADRAADLTRQLLAFSRRQVLQARVIDLNAAVVDAESLLARVIGEDVTVRTSLASGLAPVRVDPVQVTQVLLNLALNARDAMPGGGTLSIETGAAILDEAYARAHPGVTPGPHVMLAVTDTGLGMDAETLSHAFEPFFTTKPVGEGTGLGLATVFGIVAQSGGTIWVYSEPGLGTTFKVYLPAAKDAAGAKAAPPGAGTPQRADNETVLLAEDDAGVRALVERLLTGAGYRVLAADGPNAAEAMSTAHAGPIHLLLTDVVMPGRSGPALAASIRAARPTIRALFMSGYPRDSIGNAGSMDDRVAFISKPFAGDALVRKVREVLDAPVESSVGFDSPDLEAMATDDGMVGAATAS